MSDPRKEQVLFLIAAGLMLVFYVFGLFLNVTGDAAKYAFISKQMAANGEWLAIDIAGEPYLQKPQFFFWLSALSFKLFGVSNFTYKLPVFLYSLLGFWATFRLGKSLYDERIGSMAATMMAFSLMLILYNSDIHIDIVLQTNVVLSLWLIYEYVKTQRWIYLIAGAFAVGLSVLTKGPFGAMMPFFAVLGYTISQKKMRLLYHPNWLIFILIVVAISSLAVIPLYQQKGLEGIWFFIWENNIGRITGKYMGTTPDPAYYLHTLAYLLLPWTIVVGAGIYFQFKKFILKQLLPQEQYLFWSIWVIFIILSIAQSKLPHYIQSLVPMLFILTANAWQHYFLRIKNPWKRAHQLLLSVLWGIIMIAPILYHLKKGIPFFAISLAFLLFAIPITHKLLPGKRLYLNTLILTLAMAFTLNAFLLPQLLKNQAEPVAAKMIETQITEGEQVFNYNVINLERQHEALLKKETDRSTSFDKTPDEKHFFLNYEFMFYSDQNIHQIENRKQLQEVIDRKGAWIYADEKGKDEILGLAGKAAIAEAIPHFNLRRPARSIDLNKGKIIFEKHYLIHIRTTNVKKDEIN
jgi:4-amino-4-deoxy-L-arabinose transferase-like glycosyltransferase